ncbi:MAG: hypothetical protein GEU99_08110 [Luteitalea sp.]|nr:hypothetical protein [Luteitalea sp.]
MTRVEAVQEEDRRLRRVRLMVDLTVQLLARGQLDRTEGQRLVAATRAAVLRLFPGSEATYELLYAPKFERLLERLPEGAPTAESVRQPDAGRYVH